MGNENSKKFFNEIELSRRWGISEKTLQQQRWKGAGPRYVKIGNRVRYPIDEVERYERDNMKG